ncbi:MAG TPA: hypothetical protein VFX59_22170 [Polyangiales bacterium]|nr:hypothetical protein [Polyangiales bacterium]
MEAFKRLTLALAAVALAGVGCGDDDGDDKVSQNLDASTNDAALDSAIKSDSSVDAAAFACTSYTPATATMCGGSHCLQTPAQLKTEITASSVCKTDAELDKFCSLEAVNKVSACILKSVGATDRKAATKACATMDLPDFTSGCLDCFVESAECAAVNCIAKCYPNPNTAACDECRVTSGCIPKFYTCAGIDSPLPGM